MARDSVKGSGPGQLVQHASRDDSEIHEDLELITEKSLSRLPAPAMTGCQAREHGGTIQ